MAKAKYKTRAEELHRTRELVESTGRQLERLDRKRRVGGKVNDFEQRIDRLIHQKAVEEQLRIEARVSAEMPPRPETFVITPGMGAKQHTCAPPGHKEAMQDWERYSVGLHGNLERTRQRSIEALELPGYEYAPPPWDGRGNKPKHKPSRYHIDTYNWLKYLTLPTWVVLPGDEQTETATDIDVEIGELERSEHHSQIPAADHPWRNTFDAELRAKVEERRRNRH